MRRSAFFALVFALSITVLPAAGFAAPPEAVVAGPPGSYIVVLDSGNPQSVADEHRRNHGAEVGHVYRHALRGYSARMSPQAAARVAADSRVDYVDVDGAVHAAHHRCGHLGVTCDDNPAEQVVPWGVERIGAPSSTATGAGVHVYVLDTGIDATHADLKTNLGNGFAVEACKGGSCGAAWDDDHGHGTHVAGTIAASDNDIDVVGVAPEATLHSVKVLSNSGSGTRSGVIAGIDWVTQEIGTSGKAGVVNMSLGGAGSKTGTCTTTGLVGTDAYHASICNARNAGAVFAVAAGNDGGDAATKVPAAYDDAVITVSATNSSNGWTSWSNWGVESATWTGHNSAPVAIAAPGASVLSTAMGGGTTTKSGTSMAAPHVAGAIALLLQGGGYPQNGTTFGDVRAALLTGAESTAGWNTAGKPHDEFFLDVLLGGPGVTGPTANFTYDCTDLTCKFDAGTSTGSSLTYVWNFGDTNTGTGETTTHPYSGAGTYPVELTVTDDIGTKDSTTQSVTVSVASDGDLTLSVTTWKQQGWQKATLNWEPTATTVDVFRDGVKIPGEKVGGEYTDDIGKRGGGSYVYKVCEANTDTCSNEVVAQF